MNTFFEEIQQTLFPKLDGRDGPLPTLLIALTIVTGLVDSFSYLVLGHVFVANMTGNVVFLAFALAGAKGFSIASSLIAIAAFLVGSVGGGRIFSRMGQNRGRHLSAATLVQVVLVAIAVTISLISPNPVPSSYGYGLIICLAISMGFQNSAARKLAVPDLTTTPDPDHHRNRSRQSHRWWQRIESRPSIALSICDVLGSPHWRSVDPVRFY